MAKEIKPLEVPYNANERYLYGVCIRLEAIIDMMSSFMEVYANQNGFATTDNVVEEKVEEVKPKRSRKKKVD